MKSRIVKRDLFRTIRSAKSAAQVHDGREICGLLVHNGYFIEMRETKNLIEKGGGFQFDTKQVRAIKKAVDLLGHEIVGTFHSHPLYLAKPGDGDLKGALDDSLMLIVDCVGNEALLWRIKGGRARRVAMQVIEL